MFAPRPSVMLAGLTLPGVCMLLLAGMPAPVRGTDTAGRDRHRAGRRTAAGSGRLCARGGHADHDLGLYG